MMPVGETIIPGSKGPNGPSQALQAVRPGQDGNIYRANSIQLDTEWTSVTRRLRGEDKSPGSDTAGRIRTDTLEALGMRWQAGRDGLLASSAQAPAAPRGGLPRRARGPRMARRISRRGRPARTLRSRGSAAAYSTGASAQNGSSLGASPQRSRRAPARQGSRTEGTYTV